MRSGGKNRQTGSSGLARAEARGGWYWGAAVIVAAGALGFAFWFRERIFWDFRLCYAAAWLYGQGQNPFDNKLLFAIPNLDPMPFAYPLPTTLLFLPLTKLAFPVAAMVWFGVSSTLLGALVILWWRQFGGGRDQPWFPLLCLLVLNLAVLKTLLTGNVVIVESALLWAAFYFLVRGNVPGFVALLLPAAAFKMSPLVFLGLPLIHPQLRRWRTVGVGVMLFAGYRAVGYELAPGWFKDYQANVLFNVKEWSQADVFNPSTYALSRRLVSICLPGLHGQGGLLCSGALYGLMVAGVLWTSWKVARALARRTWAEASRPAILYATLVYALIMPRMSDYSYIVVIPAVLYVTGTILAPPGSVCLAVALLVPLPFVSFRNPGTGEVAGDFFFGAWGYWSWVMVLACWWIASKHLLGWGQRQAQATPRRRNHNG